MLQHVKICQKGNAVFFVAIFQTILFLNLNSKICKHYLTLQFSIDHKYRDLLTEPPTPPLQGLLCPDSISDIGLKK